MAGVCVTEMRGHATQPTVNFTETAMGEGANRCVVVESQLELLQSRAVNKLMKTDSDDSMGTRTHLLI